MLRATWGPDRVEHVAFNDVVLSRVPGRGQALLALSVDGQLLVRYASDGVIAATPAGSTAYSYAAGGPIVSPQTRAMIVTPDAPHGLFNRAVVLGAEERLGVEVLPTAPRSRSRSTAGCWRRPTRAGASTSPRTRGRRSSCGSARRASPSAPGASWGSPIPPRWPTTTSPGTSAEPARGRRRAPPRHHRAARRRAARAPGRRAACRVEEQHRDGLSLSHCGNACRMTDEIASPSSPGQGPGSGARSPTRCWARATAWRSPDAARRRCARRSPAPRSSPTARSSCRPTSPSARPSPPSSPACAASSAASTSSSTTPGRFGRPAPFEDVAFEDWQAIVATNLTGRLRLRPGGLSGDEGSVAARRADHQQRLDLRARPAPLRGRLHGDQARHDRPDEADRPRGPRARHRLRADRHRQRRDRHDRGDGARRAPGRRLDRRRGDDGRRATSPTPCSTWPASRSTPTCCS